MAKAEPVLMHARVEVCEGSWAGRTGLVVGVPQNTPTLPDTEVLVRFDDNGRTENVVACTLAEEVIDRG